MFQMILKDQVRGLLAPPDTWRPSPAHYTGLDPSFVSQSSL